MVELAGDKLEAGGSELLGLKRKTGDDFGYRMARNLYSQDLLPSTLIPHTASRPDIKC